VNRALASEPCSLATVPSTARHTALGSEPKAGLKLLTALGSEPKAVKKRAEVFFLGVFDWIVCSRHEMFVFFFYLRGTDNGGGVQLDCAQDDAIFVHKLRGTQGFLYGE
jgi:hypothetical protein